MSGHRCSVHSAESWAGQYHYYDVERAAQHLLNMLDELMRTGARRAYCARECGGQTMQAIRSGTLTSWYAPQRR
jgi:hypothetical protein